MAPAKTTLSNWDPILLLSQVSCTSLNGSSCHSHSLDDLDRVDANAALFNFISHYSTTISSVC